MKKVIELDKLLNAICQDCSGEDYGGCEYINDCSLVNIAQELGYELVHCKDCYFYKATDDKVGSCKCYPGVPKFYNGYCNVGLNMKGSRYYE